MERRAKRLSKYTTQIRWLVESNWDFGLKEYPIFDEAYRIPLNNKIIEHYYFREIGFETAALFNRFLNRTMNEIMPYYNQLYESELIEFNPLYTIDYNETYTKKTTGSSEGNTTGEGTEDAMSVHSATPQGMLAVGDIKTNTWADDANIDNGKTTSNINTSNSLTNLDDYAKHVVGKASGSDYVDLINKLRSSFINIDMMVIEALGDLFMNLY